MKLPDDVWEDMKYALQALGNALQSVYGQKTTPMPTQPAPDNATPSVTPLGAKKIYSQAVLCLNQHVTLDNTVSPDLGCAEAVSYVLERTGIENLPPKGYAGTAKLFAFLTGSPNFEQVDLKDAVPGDIIISPTGSPGATMAHGHTGILARYGILSNNSYTGKFDESLNLDSWRNFFQVRGGFPVYFFRWNP